MANCRSNQNQRITNFVIRIKKIATTVDPKSFIVISNARETWGKGFEKE